MKNARTSATSTLSAGDLVAWEALKRSHHRCQHVGVEAGVDLCGAIHQDPTTEASREHVDVGEVASLCPIEEGEQRPPDRPANSSGSKVGPTIETTGGWPADTSIAMSTSRSPSPCR